MDFKNFTYEKPEEIEALAEVLEDFNEKFMVLKNKAETDEKYKKLIYGEKKEPEDVNALIGKSFSLEDFEEDENSLYYGALCSIYEAANTTRYIVPV